MILKIVYIIKIKLLRNFNSILLKSDNLIEVCFKISLDKFKLTDLIQQISFRISVVDHFLIFIITSDKKLRKKSLNFNTKFTLPQSKIDLGY